MGPSESHKGASTGPRAPMMGWSRRSGMSHRSWRISHRDIPPKEPSPMNSYSSVLRRSVTKPPWMYTPRDWTPLIGNL